MSLDDLSNKIEQKLDFLLASLENLNIQQKNLEENSERLKNLIHSSADKEVTLLKQRERQLIRQVEVVTSRQRTALGSEIAKLLQIKGSLYATKEIQHQCQREDFEVLRSLIEILVARLKPVENLKFISVQFDSQSLESAISSFGKIQIPDLSMNDYPCSSSVFPSSMEEYGDSDHDILHKSIGMCSGIRSDEESTIVKVQIPKIPDSEWLAKSSNKSLNSPILSVKSDVSSWLADLHVSQNSTSEDKKSDSSFEMIDCVGVEQTSPRHVKKEKSRSSSIGSSIEIVSQISSEKDCRSHVSTSNLDDNKNCWLNLSRSMFESKEMNGDVSLPIDMEELACQANEPCKNYDECVCDGYCKEIAKERALQTSKWLLKSETEKVAEEFAHEGTLAHQTGLKRKLPISEGGKEVLKHMKFIWNSDKHRWLSSESLSYSMDNKVNIIDSILYKPRSHSWLSAVTSSEKQDLQSPLKYSPHSNIWLLHKMKEMRKTLQDQKNKAQQATENSSHNTLLVSDLKGALAELSAILPKYSPNTNFSSISNGSGHFIHTLPNSSDLPKFNLHNKGQVHDFTLEHARKLQWLSQSEAKHPVLSNSSFSKSSSNTLPDSLVELAEKDLNKWLMDRL